MGSDSAAEVLVQLAAGRLSVAAAATALREAVAAGTTSLDEVRNRIDAAAGHGSLPANLAHALVGQLAMGSAGASQVSARIGDETLFRAPGEEARQLPGGDPNLTIVRPSSGRPAAIAPEATRLAPRPAAASADDATRIVAPGALASPALDPNLTQVEPRSTASGPAASPSTRAGGFEPRAPAAGEWGVTALVGAAPGSGPLPSAATSSGTLVRGRFRLESRIGGGGMGVVFSAIDQVKADAGDPRSRVAIKLLNADLQNHPDAFVAMQREASKAQTLAHPNIATVFDFDRDGDTCFLVMELLQGRSLDIVIRDAPQTGMERKAALPIIRGMAEGLAYAHRKGIVHSDLKPANIFLTTDGTPKVLDFGIARSVPSLSDAAPEDTFDAGRLGAYTEAYATEEMIAGGDAAAADDVYALGIIVYQLLTSQHPFARNSAPKARQLGLAPAPIRQLPSREWKALAQALAFDRSRRPRDASEFLRLFFGAPARRRALIAATVVLASASAYLGYANYRQAGPAVPFEQLPAATQQKLTALMSDGDHEWGFYAKEGADYALWSSIDLFSEAYALHPRDRRAVQGLQRAADALLKQTQGTPDRQREVAKALSEKSEYLAKYPPVAKLLTN